MFAYLAIALFLFSIWMYLFLKRADLRTEMLVSSVVIIFVAFFDLLSQPSYWKPQTLFNLPVGIEGLIAGFSFGGIASVLYETLFRKRLKRFKGYKKQYLRYWFLPIIILSSSLIFYFIFVLNMMHALPLGMLLGVIYIMILRRDLIKECISSSLIFGLLYLSLFYFWFLLFPEAKLWWNLDIFWGITVLSVPLGEVLFGFLLGALWGPIYEFIFGYQLKNSV